MSYKYENGEEPEIISELGNIHISADYVYLNNTIAHKSAEEILKDNLGDDLFKELSESMIFPHPSGKFPITSLIYAAMEAYRNQDDDKENAVNKTVSVVELKEFLVVYDYEEFMIWSKNQYENYVNKALSVGATPAVKVITTFDKEDSFLNNILFGNFPQGETTNKVEVPPGGFEKIMRGYFHMLSDEQWQQKRHEFPYNVIPFIVYAALQPYKSTIGDLSHSVDVLNKIVAEKKTEIELEKKLHQITKDASKNKSERIIAKGEAMKIEIEKYSGLTSVVTKLHEEKKELEKEIERLKEENKELRTHLKGDSEFLNTVFK